MRYIAVVMLMILPLASAGSPWLMNDMGATIEFWGDIIINQEQPSSSPNWVEGEFYLAPAQTSLQSGKLISVSLDGSYTVETDKFQNNYISFRWIAPTKDKLEYELVWDVEVDNLRYAITSIGQVGDALPEPIKRYVEPDNLTQWTPFMKTKAESIIKGSGSALEAVRRLSDWVSSILSYDRSCWKDTFPAEQVFTERIGVCDEFTNLFISLARSVGIPARYVEGLVFSGEEWNFHAWAEVYINEWLPVDATYNEVGFVDSSHVAFAKVPGDSDVYNRLAWEGKGVSADFGSDDFSVEITSTSPQQLTTLDAEFKDLLGSSEITLINVTLTNLANSYLVATCSLNMPTEMSLLDSEEKSALIAPEEQRTLSWKIASPPDLDPQFLHKMPMQILCFPGLNLTGVVTIDPRKSHPPVFSAKVLDLTVIDEETAIVRVLNDGTNYISDLNVSLCVESSCHNDRVSLKAGEVLDIEFSGLRVSEGDRIEVLMISDEFTISLGETMTDITQQPMHVTGEPKIPSLTLSDTPTQPVSQDASMVLILVIIIVVLMVMAIFLFVLTRR